VTNALIDLVEQNLSAAVESVGGGDGGFSPASVTSSPVCSRSCDRCSATLAGRSVRVTCGQLPADVVRLSTVKEPVPVTPFNRVVDK